MSLTAISLWILLGAFLGAGVVIGFSGSGLLRNILLRQILRSNKTGWVLTQRGTRYTLDPLDRDEDANCYKIEKRDKEEYAEDTAGMMHTLEGVPLGLRLEGERPMVDVETAESAAAQEKKILDGGKIEEFDDDERPDDPETDVMDLEEMDVEEVEEHFIVGEKIGSKRKLLYINPFCLREQIPDIVDLRAAPKALKHDTDPDTPRKAAKNAVEAERSFSSWSDLKEFGKVTVAFVLGMIATYAGTTVTGGGGGGGGGGAEAVDVGLTALPALMDTLPMVI